MEISLAYFLLFVSGTVGTLVCAAFTGFNYDKKPTFFIFAGLSAVWLALAIIGMSKMLNVVWI